MIKVGINGFGRIGRNVFRILQNQKDIEVVLINDLNSPETTAHLLKYDSVYGRNPIIEESQDAIQATQDGILIQGKEIKVTSFRDPSQIPWGANQVDIVLESTGVFRQREQLELHLKAGARKVCLSVPPKDEIDAIIVMGVNDNTLKPEHKLVSNASCTTNCLAPLAKVLDDTFGIESGLMTTVHSYTNDQVILDVAHSDLRRARAAAVNIIPTTTGAAGAVGKVLPQLKGKLDGMAMRVPTPVGSLVDFVVNLKESVTKEQVNQALRSASENELKGILKYTEDPIVLADIVKDSASSIIDASSTMLIGEKMIKVISWYDNEYGYSNRCVDLIKKMA